MNIEAQLKAIDKEEAKLARKRKRLEKKLETASALDKQLEEIVANSGFKTAKALIKALVSKYESGSKAGGTRKRIRMTGEMRDEIKAELADGASMNAVAKGRDISYQVVVKVKNGGYDHL